MNTRPLNATHQVVLCAAGCGDEHGCGVIVTNRQIATGEWEREVLLAHWLVLTLGGHEHKQPFCSITCLTEWCIRALHQRDPRAPLGVEPTNPAPFPEQNN